MRLAWLVALYLVTVPLAWSQSAPVSPESEFQKRIKVSEDIQPLGDNPFGEQISLYNGSLSFEQTDVSEAGTGPALQLTRSFHLPDVSPATVYHTFLNNAFVDWSLEVPRLETLSAANGSGNLEPPDTAQWFFISSAQRCSSLPSASHMFVAFKGTQIDYPPQQWWHGYQLIVPGAGTQEVLTRDASNTLSPQMTVNGQTATFPLVTKQHWAISCLASTSNSQPGEGFLAVSPDGTSYWLDALFVKKADLVANGGGGALYRRIAMMLASKIVDRFGNTLNLSYDANGNLTGMVASDGRQVSLTWESWQNQAKDAFGNYYNPVSYRIHAITLQPSAGSPRTWTYAYSSDPYLPRLTSVTQPDGSAWSFNLGSFAPLPSDGYLIDNTSPCAMLPKTQDAVTSSGSITHPSGLTGTFTVQSTVRGRSYVSYICDNPNSPSPEIRFPNLYKQNSIIQKTFAGAGLPTYNWTYSYSGFNYSWSKDCASGCASTVATDVVDPSGHDAKYTFSNKFDASEGVLLETDYYAGAPGSTLLRSEANSYASPTVGPWPVSQGTSPETAVNQAQAGQLIPVSQRTLQQDGDTYVWLAEAFDAYAQVTKVKRYNSIAGQAAIEEQTIYLNDLPHWVLGLTKEVDNVTTGEQEAAYNYNLANLTLQSRSKFGQTLMNYTFDSQGQLASFTDPNSHTTTLSNYKRGIPQAIAYPDNTSQSIAVDDFGQIASITDQAGNITSYSYDSIGRIAGITYPSGDEVAWYPKSFSYAYVTSAERGVGAGHWRRTSTKGNAVTTTYFDALLRPVLSDVSISGTANSDISTRTDFDWKGQKTFVSYPVSGAPDLGSIGSGTSSTYDALERLIQTQQTSELGTLTTTTAYLSGARKQVTDPKGYVTTASYQVFDQPVYDVAVKLQTPEGITQSIARDLYGNPLSITQSGNYGTESDNVSKTLIYDSYHRLCRTIEPESGSEVTAYDAANNVAWTASGMTITGSGCGQEQVPTTAQTSRTYDAMNRVLTLAPPSGTQSTAYTYDPLGNLATANSGITTWSGARNKLALLTSETLGVSGNGSNVLRYAHDAYGNVRTISYPDATVVDYAPDALGRATQVGSYAHGINYFADGDVASFTFGNGDSYAVQKNARLLLSNFTYGNGSTLKVSEDYAYDANGNISTINDLAGGLRSKVFGYDTLNRLTQAQATNLWGTESYTYDPLNNIRSRISGGQTFTYNYDATNRLASITQGATSVITLQYDTRGNVNNRNGTALTFDAKNQLTSVQGYDTYAYDASGRRVLKTPANNGSPTYYFYNQAGQLLYQYDAGSYLATDYIYLGKKLIARNVTDTSILQPSEVNVTLTLVGAPSLSADGQQINATVDISNHGTATLTSSGLHPVHLGNHTVDRSGNILVNDITRANIPDIAPGAHAAVTISTPANQALGTGNLVQYEPVQEGVAWFRSWGTQPITVGPFMTCATGSPPALCNTSSLLAPNEAKVNLSLVAAPTLSADAQTFTTVIDIANQGTITLSSSGTYPERLGDHLVDSAGRLLVTDITRANIPDIAPGSHAAVSISMPTNGVLGTGDYIQYLPIQENQAWFDAWGNVPVTVSPLVSLSVPSSSSNGNYSVSWGGIAGAVSYNLQEQPSGGGWTNVQSNTAASWNASGRSTGTYSYRVQACGTSGCGPWSTVQSINVLLPPPTPTGITVPATSNGPIPVSWNASPTATRYDLYENVNNAGWTLVASTASTSVTVTATTSGSYLFFVAAYNASGWNGAVDNSAQVAVTIPPTIAPSLSAPSSNNSGSYTVSWSAITGATSYNLEEQVNGGGWTVVQSSGSTSWSASGKSNATYGYMVQACNAGGCGPWSGVSSVSVVLLPAVPTGLHTVTVNPTKGSYAVAWTAVSGATSYNMQQTLPDGTVNTPYSGTATQASATDIGTNGTVTVQVRACNGSGCSAWSAGLGIMLNSN
jgi:YD repeat-containing protein